MLSDVLGCSWTLKGVTTKLTTKLDSINMAAFCIRGLAQIKFLR